MSDSSGHNSSATRETPSSKMPDPKTPNAKTSGSVTNQASLTQWIRSLIDTAGVHVRSRLRGNNLHILIESRTCPDAAAIVPYLTQALTTTSLEPHLPPGSPQVYQVFVYGRELSQSMPAWTETFYLNQVIPATTDPVNELSVAESPAAPTAEKSTELHTGTSAESALEPPAQPHSDPLPVAPPATVPTARTIPLIDRARLGQPDAIARYLSSVFSHLGVAVKAKVETLGGSDGASAASATGESALKRLFIACESAYSPDPLMLADPIAQRLRELELADFRDAVVLGQVRGEPRPEWLLRVDLTPTNEILQAWARWGDVQAIAQLLNRLLAPEAIEVSALLKDSTLHLTCQSQVTVPGQLSAPDQLTAIAIISPTLDSLAPQGIRGTTIYGVGQDPATTQPTPHWVRWLDLPAVTQPALAPTTLELAQQGNLDAITFLLTRLLNPNLQKTLATGGIRVQIRRKDDLLHVMTDAPTCPNQGQVAPAIIRFIQPLRIAKLTGVRVYGRRAGQKHPLWSYGVDFITRSRLVPEATPEFAASDAYVNDLLSPPGALVLREDLPPNDWRSIINRWLVSAVETTQRSLIRSQLFIPLDSATLDPAIVSSPHPRPLSYQGGKVALVWGTVGALLVVQADWLLGQVVQPPPSSPTAAVVPSPSPAATPSLAPVQLPPEALLPHLSLKKNKAGNDAKAFNSSGFTQPGTKPLTSAASTSEKPTDDSATDGSGDMALAPALELPASPLQPKADVATAPGAESYPTFNSRQLDERLALYQRYLAQHGAPDVLVIGSSRALRGIDPTALKQFLAEQGYTDVSIFNFGINGATAQVVDLIVRQLLPQEKLPKLILFADGARAFNSGRQDVTYNGILASAGYRTLVAGNPPIPGTTLAPGAIANKNRNADEPTSVTDASTGTTLNSYQAVNQELNKQLGLLSQAYSHRDRLKTLLQERLAAILPVNNPIAIAFGGSLSPQNLSDATSPAAAASNAPAAVLVEGGAIDVDGFLPLSNRFNPATYYQKYARVSGDYDSDYDSFNLEGEQTEALVALVQFAQEHKVPFVFANLPMTNDYLDPIRKRHEEQFQQHMLRLASQLGFTYRDLSLTMATQPNYFSDPSHLNRYGAYEVSRRLAEDVMIPWQRVR